jgi:hypothetical protein
LTCGDLLTDLIFITEIFVSFNTSYIRDEDSKYELNRRKIALNYAMSWFLVDTISVMPRFVDTFLFKEKSDNLGQLLGVAKFLRISRILKLMRLIKCIKHREAKAKQKFKNKQYAEEEKASQNVAV